MWNRFVASLLLSFLLGSCDLPRDPEQTLSEVRGNTLIVGVSSMEAFDKAGERLVVENLAERLGAVVELQPGEIHDLVNAVENGRVHIVAGGIPESSPFSSKVAFSSPVEIARSRKTVLGTRKGENAFLLELNRTIAEVNGG